MRPSRINRIGSCLFSTASLLIYSDIQTLDPCMFKHAPNRNTNESNVFRKPYKLNAPELEMEIAKEAPFRYAYKKSRPSEQVRKHDTKV